LIQKKYINWQFKNLFKMTFNELNRINGESAFRESRLSRLKSILLLLTLGGLVIVLLWQLFDKYYLNESDSTLFWLCTVTVSVYVLNFLIALVRNSNQAYKQHLTAGFYFGTVFCTLLAMFTGASQSPYWFGLFFIFIAWFVLVPFTYRELISHGFMFFILFMAGLFIQTEFKLIDYEIAKIIFLYSGTLFIGFYAAFSRNQGEAESYLLTEALRVKNKDLNKYLKVLEQAPGSVIIMDTKMNFEYINPMFTQLSGYTEEDLLHKNINDTIYKGKAPESRTGVIQTLAKGEKWQGELLTYHKTGTPYWANTIAAPYKDEQGQVEGYIVIQQDISEHKKMEIALRESEELYRTLIEKSLDGVALTVSRKFYLFNKAFCEILGYSEEELLSIDPTELLAPDDRERVVALHDKRMIGEMGSLHYTAKFIHKSGKLLMVELNTTTVQVNGQNASFVTLRDITDQHAMKNALELSMQKYHDLADLLPQTVYELDMQGKIVFMNQAGINAFGKVLPQNDLFALDFVAPEDHQRLMQNMQASYRGVKPPSDSEYTALRADGSRYPIMVYSSPVFTDGVLSGTRGIIIDISERKEIENALRESESKYKTLVENSKDGILIIRDNKVLFANNTISKLLGYPLDEFYQMSSVNLLHPDDRYKAALIAQKRKSQDFSTINEEFRMVTRNGEVKECETSSTLIEFDGQWASFFTIQDITESRRMQTELKENEEKYRQLFVAESDAIFMIDADTGEILDANPATSSIYGYSHIELLTMKNTDISAEPEKTSEATHLHLSLVPIRYHKKKDGTVFPVELSAGFTTMGNRNIQIVTSRDITERIRIQEALSNSEQKYRELTEMLPQAIYELDAQGNPKYMNKAGLKIFGIENRTGDKKAFEFFIPEDMQRMKQALKTEAARMVDEKGVKEPVPSEPVEYTAQRTDGSKFPVLIYGTSIVENGEVTGSRGMIIDISERKAMENAIRESEEKYKTLIENSQDGIFAIVGDKVQFVNNTFCKMLGYTAQEIYDMPAISLVVPDDRQRGNEISQRRKNGDWSTVNGIFHFLTKDGSVRECDTFSSVLELNGQIVSYLTVHDLTENRRMQEQLQLSEEKYRTVIEKATDGIVITQQGKLKFMNRSMIDMLQYDENEIIDKPFINFVVEDEKQVMIDFHKRRMAGEDFSSLYRSRLIRKDGKIIAVELNARTSNYNEEPAAFIIIRDISDRVKIENELQTAKNNLEMLNRDLEQRVIESSESLTEARTQLINLQKENLQSQFDVLKQQVNPHFLFNSLNVLTSLIKLEPDLAEKFSEHLSKVYRYVLENKDNELVDLNTELNFLDAYIFLLNIRFVNKLHVNIDIPQSKRSCQVIPLAMQLLIENAIKHNIMSKSNPLKIDVFIDKNNFLNIVNNLQERPSQIISTGVGLKNIQNRYLLLNNTEPVFEKTETHFIAKVPLILID
jgi:PAS domain S-box-containing protein